MYIHVLFVDILGVLCILNVELSLTLDKVYYTSEVLCMNYVCYWCVCVGVSKLHVYLNPGHRLAADSCPTAHVLSCYCTYYVRILRVVH